MDTLTDQASLGVTELLSNVHRHARPDKTCTVELGVLLDRLKVSVHDHDPRLPVIGDAAPLDTCGRGLALVAAMSESWGARPDGESGKVVWFTLMAPSSAPVVDWDRHPRITTPERAVRRFADITLVKHAVEGRRPESDVTRIGLAREEPAHVNASWR